MRTSALSHADDGSTPRDSHDVPGAHLRPIATIAEQVLAAAIAVQSRPSLDMFVARSAAESEAIERAARELCMEAHRLGLRPEQLLIETKRAWSRLAPVRASHLGDRDGDVLREVVSTCIEVYFGERNAHAD